MDLNMNNLMLSLLFGCVGTGYFMFGKKMGQLMPILCGLGLMVVPFFFSNTWILLLACLALCAVPFVVREA